MRLVFDTFSQTFTLAYLDSRNWEFGYTCFNHSYHPTQDTYRKDCIRHEFADMVQGGDSVLQYCNGEIADCAKLGDRIIAIVPVARVFDGKPYIVPSRVLLDDRQQDIYERYYPDFWYLPSYCEI